jgi:hypothetical protein
MRFPQLPSFTFFAESSFSVGTIPPTLHGSKSSHGETADQSGNQAVHAHGAKRRQGHQITFRYRTLSQRRLRSAE